MLKARGFRPDFLVKPENLVFNANLQEFSQRVGYISALASNGKMSVESSI